MDIQELERLMVEHGLTIRAIPYEHIVRYETTHINKYPDGTIYFDERLGRNQLRVVKKNPHGGKFIIATEKTEGQIIQYWGHPKDVFTGKPVVFYDTIEQAVNSRIK